MFGYFFSNIFTASSVPGVHAHTVMLAGFLSSAAMSTFLVELPPPPPPLSSPPPHAATSAAAVKQNASKSASLRCPSRHDTLFKESSPPRRPAVRASPVAPGDPMVPDRADLRAARRNPRADPGRRRAPGGAPAPRPSSLRTATAVLRRCGRP